MTTVPESNTQQKVKMIEKVVERKNLMIAYKSVVGNHQILSPMWEPDFSDSSFGFRPNRNAGQAIKQAQAYINAGYQDIVDIDLKSFFL